MANLQPLLEKLPQTVEESLRLFDSLNYKEKGEFAAKLALKFKDDPGMKPLLKKMLETRSLGSSIPIQRTFPAPPEDGVEPVQAEIEDVKLIAPQTNACKRTPLRVMAITMACIVGDEEILQSILDHPSTLMKPRVSDALAKLRAPPPAAKIEEHKEEESPFVLFDKYFESIRKAPISVPSGTTDVETKNQIWSKYDRAPWKGGRLRSIEDLALREKVITDLMEMLITHPPVIKVVDPEKKESWHPTLPEVFSKNVAYLLRRDLNKTIEIFLSTVVKTPPTYFSLRPLFCKKLSFWKIPRENNSAVLVEALKPLFDVLEVSATSNGSGVTTNRANLTEIFNGRPVSPILYHLVDEALIILSREINEHVAAIKAAESAENKDELRSTLRQSIRNIISNSLSYIWKLLENLTTRLAAVSKIEAKAEPQKVFETYIMKFLQMIHKISENCFVMGSEVVDPTSPVDAVISQHFSNFIQPSLRATSSHPHMCLQMFRSYRSILDHFDTFKQKPASQRTALETRLFDTLQGYCTTIARSVPQYKTPTIFEYPKNALVAPYTGIPPWSNSEILSAIYEKLPASTSIEFWISLTNQGYLTDEFKLKIKNDITFEELEAWNVSNPWVIYNILDNLILDTSERHSRASELLESLKKQDMAGDDRQRRISALKERLDIRLPEVREDFYATLSVPTIEERVVAIERLMRVTNKFQSVEETYKTVSWLFQRIRNEMKLNMDAIFAVFPRFQTSKFVGDIPTEEEATQFAKVYSTFDNNILSAVTVSYPAREFITNLAYDSLKYYAGNPSHPLFIFGIEILWRHAIHDRGREQAASRITLSFSNPSVTNCPDLEVRRRKALWRAVEIAREWKVITVDVVDGDTLGSYAHYYGSFMIDEGEENKFVDGVVKQMTVRYESIPENEGKVFLDSACAQAMVKSLVQALGLRWMKSDWLMMFFYRCLNTLEASELVEKLPEDEPVLAWTSEACQSALQFIRTVVAFTPKPIDTEWYTKWSELRMRSVEATSEVLRRWTECDSDVAKQSALVDDLFRRSPSGSALHLQYIMQFVLERRPDLLRREHISERTPFKGLFNTSSNSLLVFQIENTSSTTPLPPELLLGWQADLLTERYKEEALDPKLPMPDRVLATSRMMQMKNISVHEIAEFLTTPFLPSRIQESVLMYLPHIDEPGSAINLLLAPCFLESDLARTAIFAVKNVLSYMKKEQVILVLKSLVPPATGRGPKVTVYKELVRLFAEYTNIPELLDILPTLWKQKLHKDVRIVLMQSILPLLTGTKAEVAKMAWDIVHDCVSTNNVMISGMVLALVNLGFDESMKSQVASTYMVLPSAPSFYYTYGELVTNTIKPKIRDQYLLEALIPMCSSLLNFIRDFPDKKSRDYDELVKLVTHCFYKLTSDSWIQPSNVEQVVGFLHEIVLSGALAENNSVLDTVYPYALLALGHTIAMSIVSNEAAPVPKGWSTLIEVIQVLVKTRFDASAPVAIRKKAQQRIDALNLSSYFVPTHQAKSVALKNAEMEPLECMASVPHALSYFWLVRWNRRVSLLRRDCSYLASIQAIPECEAEFKEKEKQAVAAAEDILKDLLRNSFAPVTHGMPEITEANIFQSVRQIFNTMSMYLNWGDAFLNLLDSIYKSLTWGDDIPDYPAWRTEFRFFLVKEAKGFLTGVRLADFINYTIDNESSGFFKHNYSTMTSLVNNLFSSLVRSRKALADWETGVKLGWIAADKPAPDHDEEGLQALLALLKRVASRADEQDFKAFFRIVIEQEPLSLLQMLPQESVKYLEGNVDSGAFQRWTAHVSDLLRQHGEVNDPVIGVPALKPVIEKIAAEAEACDFEPSNQKTVAFRRFFESNLELAVHLCLPVVQKYSVKNPSSFLSTLQNSLSKYFGLEASALLFESVSDQWWGTLDLTALGTAPQVEKVNLFELLLDQKADGTIEQNPESLKRRSSLTSVDGVANAFLALWTNANTSEEQRSLVKPALRQSVGTKTISIPVAESLARVGKAAATQPTPKVLPPDFNNPVAYSGYSVSSRMACLNPYLYFNIYWHLLKDQTAIPMKPVSTPYCLCFDVKGLVDPEPPSYLPEKRVNYAVPIRYLIDIAAKLTRVVAPKFKEQGLHRLAANTYWDAMKILHNIHSYTAESRYNAARSQRGLNVVLDALVLEASEVVGEEREIPGFMELVTELSTSSTQQVMTYAQTLEENAWHLRWKI